MASGTNGLGLTSNDAVRDGMELGGRRLADHVRGAGAPTDGSMADAASAAADGDAAGSPFPDCGPERAGRRTGAVSSAPRAGVAADVLGLIVLAILSWIVVRYWPGVFDPEKAFFLDIHLPLRRA